MALITHRPAFTEALDIYGSYLLFPEESGAQEALPAADLLSDALLAPTITRYAEQIQAPLPAAGSLWFKYYGAAVLLGTYAAATHGVGLAPALHNCRIACQGGTPRAMVVSGCCWLLAERCAGLEVDGQQVGSVAELHHRVRAAAICDHMAYAVNRVHRVSRAPRSVLWGNLGNMLAHMYHRLSPNAVLGRWVCQDRALVLDSPTCSVTGERNPLHNPVELEPLDEPGLPDCNLLRHTCCLRHQSATHKPCYTCPRLSSAERVALLKEHLCSS